MWWRSVGQAVVRPLLPAVVLAHLLLRQQHAPVPLGAGATPLALPGVWQAVVRVLLVAVIAHMGGHIVL